MQGDREDISDVVHQMKAQISLSGFIEPSRAHARAHTEGSTSVRELCSHYPKINQRQRIWFVKQL